MEARFGEVRRHLGGEWRGKDAAGVSVRRGIGVLQCYGTR